MFVASWLTDLPDLTPALLLRHPNQLGSWARRVGRGGELREAKPRGLPPSPSHLGVQGPYSRTKAEVPRWIPGSLQCPPHLSTPVPCPDLGDREEARDPPLEISEEGARWHRVSRFSATKCLQVQLPSSNCSEALPLILMTSAALAPSCSPTHSSQGERNLKADSPDGKRSKESRSCASVSPFLRLTSFLFTVGSGSSWAAARKEENPRPGRGLSPRPQGALREET